MHDEINLKAVLHFYRYANIQFHSGCFLFLEHIPVLPCQYAKKITEARLIEVNRIVRNLADIHQTGSRITSYNVCYTKLLRLDKHSTGGVGDVVSLMLGPMVAACGGYVPMISGRGLGHTGGTLDKFDAIPGYQTTPLNALFKKVVKEVGVAIIGQTADLAPADKRFYGIRDVTATVESIPLITASILSKKLAAGLEALVMDVKVGSGAFMPTYEKSEELAKSIVAVANGAGCRTSAVLTDMNQVLATTAGNAVEVLEAIRYLTGAYRHPRLHEVTMALCAEMLLSGNLAATQEQAYQKLKVALDSGKAAETFARMVHALGGPIDLIEKPKSYLRITSYNVCYTKLLRAVTFMAGDREQAEEAYPGDIIGLHNHGTIQIGDTFTQGEDLHFSGIPNFAPELFRRIRLRDPLKQKQLLKGLVQLSEEGAVQVFRPIENNDLIVGAVGVLQFDVVVARLKSEYNVEAIYETINVSTARWVECKDAKKFDEFQRKCAQNLALDGGDNLSYIAPTMVNLNLTMERYPDVEFHKTREH